jgi:hypothetical protein
MQFELQARFAVDCLERSSQQRPFPSQRLRRRIRIIISIREIEEPTVLPVIGIAHKAAARKYQPSEPRTKKMAVLIFDSSEDSIVEARVLVEALNEWLAEQQPSAR